jgi:putative transposase
MPEYRRIRTKGATYFFTVVTHERQPILCLPESLKAMQTVFADVARRFPFGMDAWVVLPDHIHVIWTLPEADSNYSTRWAMIKKDITKHLRSSVYTDAASTESRAHHRDGSVWQRRFWEHQIRDEPDYRSHLDYIHFNPVRHGLAAGPREWKCSSFRKWVALGGYEEDWGSDGVVDLRDNIGQE